ncbi:Serine/threonine protein phosphatase 7 long form isogeny [Arachis hypogaea]|nr:Serine/threonine protein phosphatase 7 long form isogeny [Arachis hypogaea]
MVEFEHDWSLASAFIERWRPVSHTFHLPCEEMTITLQDVAYQLGLRIVGDSVSGCISGWEQHHQEWTIEELCEQILGVVPGLEDRQSQTKWTVKLTWFHNTVCGELEQDVIEEWLMRYTRGYIMQLIGGILFPDASDSRVHIRWLPLLEDLDACGRLSWGSAVLAWLYRQMCRATEHSQRNLGGCVSLMLSWAYHRIPLVRPDGFNARRFPLYRSDNATGECRLRQYRHTLNGIGMLNVEWMPYADPQLFGLVPPAIAEANASTAIHIPTRPLNNDDMHRLDGRFGRGEWFPHLLGGWHKMWDAQTDHRLSIYHHIDLHLSLPYITWYLQWAYTELFGLGDQHLLPTRVVPEDLPIHHPLAPDLH